MILILTAVMFGCKGSANDEELNGHAPLPPEANQAIDAVMEIYATEPERALQIIDSVENAGILPDFRADVLRAKVYSWTYEDIQLDSAILIGERLMFHDSIKADIDLQEEVLETLLNSCRLRKDDEQALNWATQLSDLYRSQGKETEALRNEAEIGVFLIRIGQEEEGLVHIDSVICRLDGKRTFNELDASIIALKRKAEICGEKGFYSNMIPTAQRMLDLLDDYEQHPNDFHDGSIREPSEDDRPTYIDFYRGKAYAYMAAAYANIEVTDKKLELADAHQIAREYLSLYDQTAASHGITGRSMIAPTLRILGEYDRMLAIYDEWEQHWGTDTLNANYIEVLLGRAEAAEAQGRYTEANDYWKRYAALTELLYDRLLQGKAHLYAARFHAQEQQMEIERQAMKIHEKNRVILIVAIALIITFLLLLNTFLQKRQLVEKNAAMVKLIDEKEEQSQLLSNSEKGLRNDLALFLRIDHRIREERLYADQGVQREELAEVLGVKRETLNQLLNKYGGGISIPAYLNNIRLSEACKMLREQPETTVAEIADQVGLTQRNLQRLFQEQYGMTPTEYRASHNK